MAKKRSRDIFTKPDYKTLKIEDDEFERKFTRIMSYIHYEVNAKVLKSSTMKWVSSNNPDNIDQKKLNGLPDTNFSTIGKYFHIIVNGGEIPESYMNSVKNVLYDIYDTEVTKKSQSIEISKEEDIKVDEEKVKKPTIQDYMFEKAAETCGEIEGWIDEFIENPKAFNVKTKDPSVLFKTAELKSGHLRYVVSFYEPLISELKEAIAGEDECIKEAYSSYTKTQLKKILGLLENVIEVADHLKKSSQKKSTRKKRPVDIHKMVSKLKFMKEFPDEKLRGANSYEIVGAQEIWIYNTKTRKLGHYLCADASGLSVKGTSIKNFSDTSGEKTIRTSYNLNLVKFQKLNKSSKRKNYKEFSSMETNLTGRINDNHILLSVEK